jgi:hypothetical protein
MGWFGLSFFDFHNLSVFTFDEVLPLACAEIANQSFRVVGIVRKDNVFDNDGLAFVNYVGRHGVISFRCLWEYNGTNREISKRFFVLNSAIETTKQHDISFAWSEQDCQALGVERRDVMLAWKVLQERVEEKVSNADLIAMGYENTADFDNIILSPNYARALRIMLTQWLNVVGLPEAARTHYNMARSTKAPEAVRVKAAKHLTDLASEMLQSFKDEYGKPADEMDPETLARVIRQLEKSRVVTVLDTVEQRTIDVHSLGLRTTSDDYLSDLL